MSRGCCVVCGRGIDFKTLYPVLQRQGQVFEHEAVVAERVAVEGDDVVGGILLLLLLLGER